MVPVQRQAAKCTIYTSLSSPNKGDSSTQSSNMNLDADADIHVGRTSFGAGAWTSSLSATVPSLKSVPMDRNVSPFALSAAAFVSRSTFSCAYARGAVRQAIPRDPGPATRSHPPTISSFCGMPLALNLYNTIALLRLQLPYLAYPSLISPLHLCTTFCCGQYIITTVPIVASSRHRRRAFRNEHNLYHHQHRLQLCLHLGFRRARLSGCARRSPL